MIRFQLDLTGTSHLLCHNPRLVDPDYEITRQIKVITNKRKKTDEDLKLVERLEWFGGLYEEDGVVVQPASKVRKSLINTAKIMKLGKGLERTLSFNDLNTPLLYDGPKDIDKLFEKKEFHSRLSVGLGGKRVMRVRPAFFPWALSLQGLFITDAGVNFEDLVRIADLAGEVEGIGGFTAKINVIS
jgi:hypothetical protein